MFLNGAAGQRPPAMASSPSHPHSSQSPSDVGRSRHNSDAMDIHVITDRDPAEREHAGVRWGNSGSPSVNNKKYSSSLIPPWFSILSERD